MGPYEREAGGSESEEVAMEVEVRKREIGRCHTAGSKDRERGRSHRMQVAPSS